MISDKARANIGAAVFNEKTAAVEAHGGFHSPHEAYAVLLEEVEEVKEMHDAFDCLQRIHMRGLWDDVRSDFADFSSTRLTEIRAAALDLAYECVQVAAMCDKWGLLLESEAAASEIAK